MASQLSFPDRKHKNGWQGGGGEGGLNLQTSAPEALRREPLSVPTPSRGLSANGDVQRAILQVLLIFTSL